MPEIAVRDAQNHPGCYGITGLYYGIDTDDSVLLALLDREAAILL